MNIFDKEKYQKCLLSYYANQYGRQSSDVWYEQPAVNVWVFSRKNRLITLKSDIRTGEVTEYVEEINDEMINF